MSTGNTAGVQAVVYVSIADGERSARRRLEEPYM
jgi:hypothetical protein